MKPCEFGIKWSEAFCQRVVVDVEGYQADVPKCRSRVFDEDGEEIEGGGGVNEKSKRVDLDRYRPVYGRGMGVKYNESVEKVQADHICPASKQPDPRIQRRGLSHLSLADSPPGELTFVHLGRQ